jgi:hypothetical protein
LFSHQASPDFIKMLGTDFENIEHPATRWQLASCEQLARNPLPTGLRQLQINGALPLKLHCFALTGISQALAGGK